MVFVFDPNNSNIANEHRNNGWHHGMHLRIVGGRYKKCKWCKFVDCRGMHSAELTTMMEGDDEPTHCMVRCSSLTHRCPKTKKARQALEMVTNAGPEINAAMEKASEGELKGILGFESRPLVSCDFTDDDRSTIVDGPSTMVVNKRQVKIYAWYDNEWGYVCRLADITKMVADSL